MTREKVDDTFRRQFLCVFHAQELWRFLKQLGRDLVHGVALVQHWRGASEGGQLRRSPTLARFVAKSRSSPSSSAKRPRAHGANEGIHLPRDVCGTAGLVLWKDNLF